MTHKQPTEREWTKTRRQAQILDAAFKEFAANGYAATKLDNVAKRARVAKGTIFLHFRDKKALFRAVLCSVIQPVRADFDAAPSGPSSAHETMLRRLVARLYEGLVENKKARALLRLLVAESDKFPELADIYYSKVIAPGAATFGCVIEKGIAAGEFQGADMSGIRRFPQILVAPAVLATVWILLLNNRQTLDLVAYRKTHIDFMLRALQRDPGADAAKEKTPVQLGEAS